MRFAIIKYIFSIFASKCNLNNGNTSKLKLQDKFNSHLLYFDKDKHLLTVTLNIAIIALWQILLLLLAQGGSANKTELLYLVFRFVKCYTVTSRFNNFQI